MGEVNYGVRSVTVLVPLLAGNTVSNGVTWDTINSGIVPESALLVTAKPLDVLLNCTL